ncbi:MAG: RusA family crossover junction endodeoxyribonuclease [Armatimonadetes bacterium]|nr:RusA family crossover junction endodeoxyribonuclease [Armatimonadota bacterium]
MSPKFSSWRSPGKREFALGGHVTEFSQCLMVGRTDWAKAENTTVRRKLPLQGWSTCSKLCFGERKMQQWRFILPLPPSINHQYTERDGRWVLSREARHYKTHLQKAFRRLKAAGKFQIKPLDSLLSLFGETETSHPAPRTPQETFLSLRLEFFFKTAQRRDLDNGLKIVQDLVCEALGVDDKNVVAVDLIKRVDAQNPRLEVIVSALPSWDFSRPNLQTSSALDLRPFVPPLKPKTLKSSKRTFNLSDWLAEKEADLAES